MEKPNTNMEISRLLEYGLQRGLIAPEDKAYAANRMLALLGLREFEPQPVEEELHTPVEPLERLCQFAAEAGLIEPDTRDGRDQFDTELMNCLMPRPSQVVRKFYSLYEKDKQAATDYYYQLARSSNYIRVDRIEKDRMWTAPTPYGDLVITINLSKPEKDPKAIAAAKTPPSPATPSAPSAGRTRATWAAPTRPPGAITGSSPWSWAGSPGSCNTPPMSTTTSTASSSAMSTGP